MMGKFTDADVFRGLECCTKIENPCSGCPFDGECISGDDINILHIYALNLLKRQKVEKEAMLSHIKCLQYENDKLRTRNNELNALNKTASQEAIKEFAERLKEFIPHFDDGYTTMECVERSIKCLVAEMTEQRGDSK